MVQVHAQNNTSLDENAKGRENGAVFKIRRVINRGEHHTFIMCVLFFFYFHLDLAGFHQNMSVRTL